MSYVSRFFRLPTDHVINWYTAGCLTYTPDINRGGGAVMVDGGRWSITLIGAGGELPPTDLDGFLDYAASLDVDEILTTIAAGTPLTPAYRYARMANRWICYHRLRCWPQRLVVVGDAVCVFNPVYGQGLTVAAQQVQLLGELLADTPTLTDLSASPAITRTHYRTVPVRTMRVVMSLVCIDWALSCGTKTRQSRPQPGLGHN